MDLFSAGAVHRQTWTLMNTILPEPDIILDPPKIPEIPLPRAWTDYTFLAILHIIALARIVILNAAN
ncbi:hypothetical protein FACS189454_04540 [Planctomycetales bacterium]|nr:hypothetical protein FACS189454_04540 [Planctomycetales bacterium]